MTFKLRPKRHALVAQRPRFTIYREVGVHPAQHQHALSIDTDLIDRAIDPLVNVVALSALGDVVL